MTSTTLLVLPVLLFIVAAYCQDEVYSIAPGTDDTGKQTPTKYDEISLSENDVRKFQQNMREFSAALFNKVLKETDKTDETENVFFSPASISHALGMVNAGAKGPTTNQIKRALRLGKHNKLSYINALFKNVTNDKFMSQEDSEVVALMASRSFFKPYYNVYENYTKILKESYFSGTENLDFSQSVAAAKKINSWVEDETKGLIKDLMSPELFTPDTRFVLVNALYFKASWLKSFQRGSGEFNTTSGVINVPFLKSVSEYKVYENETENILYIGIPYTDEETFFIIIMPKDAQAMTNFTEKDSLAQFFKTLKKRVREWESKKRTLYMPEFTIEQKMDVKKVLKTMGVNHIFSTEKADLSGISNEFVYVSDFVHKAKITVDEGGTEAAAASGVAGAARSLNTAETVKINQPYIFAIYERGNILFIGRMMNPAEGAAQPSETDEIHTV